MEEKEVETDALELCLKVLKVGLEEVEIAQKNDGDVSPNFLYSLAPTPFFLEKLGVLEIIARNKKYGYPMGRKAGKFPEDYFPTGYWSVRFNIDKANEWVEQSIGKTLSPFTLLSKVPDDWSWISKSKGQYRFGSLGIYTQKGDKRRKVFGQLIDLFERNPTGFTISSLSQRVGISTPRLRIELHAMNATLAKVRVNISSSGKGIYIIRIVNSY